MFKFIIVDHYSHVRHQVASIIDWNALGFQLEGIFSNIDNGMNMIATQKIDLLLLNCELSEGTGLTLGGIVKQKFPYCRVIIYSQNLNQTNLLDAFKYKIDDFLEYPINKDTLLKAVQHIERSLTYAYGQQELLLRLKVKVNFMEQVLLHQNCDNTYLKEADTLLNKRNMQKYQTMVFNNIYCVIMLQERGQEGFLSTRLGNSLDDQLFHTVDNALKHMDNCLVVKNSYHYPTIIFSATNEELLDKYLDNCIPILKNHIAKTVNKKVTMSTGRKVCSLNNLTLSWRDALLGLQDTSLSDKTIEEVLVSLNKETELYLYSIENDIKCNINKSNYKQVVYNIHMFFRYIQLSISSHEAYHFYRMRLIKTINNSLSKNTDVPVKMITEYFSPVARSNLYRIEKDEQLLIKNIKEVMYSHHFKKVNNVEAICEDAVLFIKNNYQNAELSLNMICKYLALSVSYFSSIFKSNFGTTFIDYLTCVRIERAKQLLANTSLKSYEIAEKVGYNDPHYFSILFKKKTGMTPTQFKNHMEKAIT